MMFNIDHLFENRDKILYKKIEECSAKLDVVLAEGTQLRDAIDIWYGIADEYKIARKWQKSSSKETMWLAYDLLKILNRIKDEVFSKYLYFADHEDFDVFHHQLAIV